MNCLLLLIILFCCNGNGCNTGNCNMRGCNTGRGNMGGCNTRRSNMEERNTNRHDCECNVSPCANTHTPPPMPRTQFPYLDVEPRTCGCEEKSNN